MANTLSSVTTDVLTRLGDTEQEIWSESEIQGYIKEGYDRLCLGSGALWEMDYLPDEAMRGNVTADWEKDYLDAGEQYTGTFSFTSPADRDYVHENAAHDGPANHTHLWEHTSEYTDAFYGRAVHNLPGDVYDIERATWDYKRIDPLRSMELEGRDNRYELEAGEVLGYIRDKDGINVLRKWRVPSAQQSNYTITGNWGLLRDASDASGETVFGSWGIARRVPGQHPVRGPFGFTRTVHGETNNVRIEFIRRGAALDDEAATFEIPERYVKHIRWYAHGKALERNGPGQDTELAKAFLGLFDAGVARIVGRRQRIPANRILEIGGNSRENNRPPLARLPWQYGRYAGRVPL